MAQTIKNNIPNIISRQKLTVEPLKMAQIRIPFLALYCIFHPFDEFLAHFGSIFWLLMDWYFVLMIFWYKWDAPSHPEYLKGCLVAFKMAWNGPKMTFDFQKNTAIYCIFMGFWLIFDPFFWPQMVPGYLFMIFWYPHDISYHPTMPLVPSRMFKTPTKMTKITLKLGF